MSMRRRTFLKLGAAALPLVLSEHAVAILSARSVSTIKQHRLYALAPYLDTLLPADDTSPSASVLEVHGLLVEHALGIENYIRLLELGCRWLDAQAPGGREFAQLDGGERERIVRNAEQARSGTTERLFFDRTLTDTLQLYYAHPGSWPALRFAGPPQPAGFMDYAAAPNER